MTGVNSNPSLRYLTLLSVLLLAACFQQFEAVRAIETKSGLAFEIPAMIAGLRQGQVYQLWDFTVVKHDCAGDCTMWFIVRQPDSTNGEPLKTARLYYGSVPAGMAARMPAKTLSPGRYSLSATVQQRDAADRFRKSLSLNGMLSIRQGESVTPQVSHECR